MAEKKHNIFISHYGEDERQLDSLKQRLRDHGCDIRNSSVEKKKYRPYKVTDATIARYLRICIRWAKTFIVMIGEHTHKRPWVNYEIRNAARQGKAIIKKYERKKIFHSVIQFWQWQSTWFWANHFCDGWMLPEQTDSNRADSIYT